MTNIQLNVLCLFKHGAMMLLNFLAECQREKAFWGIIGVIIVVSTDLAGYIRGHRSEQASVVLVPHTDTGISC